MNKPTFLRAIIGAALIVLTACAGPRRPAAVSISQPQAAARAPFATATSSALTVAGRGGRNSRPIGSAGVAAALAANAKTARHRSRRGLAGGTRHHPYPQR